MQNLAGKLVDYHVHSSISIDGMASIDDFCRRAVEMKIVEIGFTEHVESKPQDPGHGFLDYERYSQLIEEA